jgi:hypothetical protein
MTTLKATATIMPPYAGIGNNSPGPVADPRLR